MRYIALLSLLTLPALTYAADLQSYIKSFTAFLGNVIVPFLIGIAFLLFAFNAIKYFVVGSESDEGRDKAKNLAIYSVLAMVFILIFWGIINLLAGSLNLADGDAPQSDYFGQ